MGKQVLQSETGKGLSILIELNRIYQADCFDLLVRVKPESVDLVFTDPPYLKSITGAHKSWELKPHDFEVLAESFNQVLKRTGQIAIFGDYITQVTITNSFQKHFEFRFYWVWVKSNGQPVNRFQPRSNVELISVWKKRGVKTGEVTYNPISLWKGKPYIKRFQSDNRTRKGKIASYTTINKTGDRYPDQVLCFPSKDNLSYEERTAHPTQKPLGLCRYVIKSLSSPGDVILDPFSGSGSISISAHLENRQFIGIEKNTQYWNESIRRLKRYQAQLRLSEVVG